MRRKYLILFSLSGLVLCCDQLTKHLVQGTLHLRQRIELIPGLFSITHQTNSGFAFGFFQKAPPSLQEVFFIGVPVFALILIVLIFIKLQDDQILTSIALTTILGGAVGNLIDRVQYGYVIDFIDIHAGTFHLPPFNVADVSILAGVGMMFLGTFKQVPVES